MTEVAVGLYFIVGFVIAIGFIFAKISFDEESPENRFKKIYRKRGHDFFLCDYCTRCKMKYTHKEKTSFYPFEKEIVTRTLTKDCPFKGDNAISIENCNLFELDKSKV